MNITGDRKATPPRPAPGARPTIGARTGSIESEKSRVGGAGRFGTALGSSALARLGGALAMPWTGRCLPVCRCRMARAAGQRVG